MQTTYLNHTHKKEQGFTLVELAIVMIIIGLLIGGVLKGQQLIENAKVTSTISQIKGFQAALNSFRDTYSAMPGDMRNALSRLSGCSDGAKAINNCAAGDGNGLIMKGVEEYYWDAKVAADPETSQAFKHMALADLITGVQTNASGAATEEDVSGAETAAGWGWGESHPASALRGGYELFYSTKTDIADSAPTGHMLRMSNAGVSGDGTTAAVIGTAGASPASPLQAANIDRKMDDGRPQSGTVLSAGGEGNSATSGCNNGNEYNELLEQKNCVMLILIDG